jgi:hypothetical protein
MTEEGQREGGRKGGRKDRLEKKKGLQGWKRKVMICGGGRARI